MICVQWCDKITGRWATDAHVFQSTHPVRGATAFATSLPSRSSDFNPRTPCGVRRHASHQSCRTCCISIHAPHAGCDRPHIAAARPESYFNPRTPCGVRQQVSTQQQPTNYFNPRTPCGVRRSSSVLSFSRRCHFNPRTPCGVRPDVCILITLHVAISIHAPHAGCDPFKTVRSERLLLFQSTHPMRGATSPSGMRLTRRSNFNPRTPCGVRRFCASTVRMFSFYFNPRTPCGVRRNGRDKHAHATNFNPRTPCGVRPPEL